MGQLFGELFAGSVCAQQIDAMSIDGDLGVRAVRETEFMCQSKLFEIRGTLVIYLCVSVGITTRKHPTACRMIIPLSQLILCIRLPKYAIIMANNPWMMPFVTRSQSNVKKKAKQKRENVIVIRPSLLFIIHSFIIFFWIVGMQIGRGSHCYYEAFCNAQSFKLYNNSPFIMRMCSDVWNRFVNIYFQNYLKP